MTQGAGMNIRSLAGNAAVAFAAQGVSLLASVAMSLIVPKVLGVTTYGYWQLFVFYTSYSGLFQFGLNDGVYLIEGGKTRDEINKKAVNCQFSFGALMQLVVSTCIVAIAVFTATEPERLLVLVAFGIYTFIFNLQGFLGYLFQAMNETKLYSFASIIERTIFLIAMFVLVALRVESFVPYIVLYTASKTISLGYCAWCARDFLSSGCFELRQTLSRAIGSIEVGIGLMVANVASMLILGVMRLMIDNAWGIEVFGRVSFALSMVSFFITFVSQASMVLFPALRQGTDAERRAFYRAVRNMMEIILPVVYLLYFPMVAVLSLWLPQYASSMIYFAFLLPICVFDTKMDICCTTYFKVLRKERLLLVVNVVTCVCSAIASLVGIYLLGSLEAVLAGVVACIIGRSIWSEGYLNKHLKVAGGAIAFEEVVITIAFVLFSTQMPGIFAFASYAIFYLIYLIANRDVASELVHQINRLVLSRQKR